MPEQCVIENETMAHALHRLCGNAMHVDAVALAMVLAISLVSWKHCDKQERCCLPCQRGRLHLQDNGERQAASRPASQGVAVHEAFAEWQWQGYGQDNEVAVPVGCEVQETEVRCQAQGCTQHEEEKITCQSFWLSLELAAA